MRPGRVSPQVRNAESGQRSDRDERDERDEGDDDFAAHGLHHPRGGLVARTNGRGRPRTAL